MEDDNRSTNERHAGLLKTLAEWEGEDEAMTPEERALDEWSYRSLTRLLEDPSTDIGDPPTMRIPEHVWSSLDALYYGNGAVTTGTTSEPPTPTWLRESYLAAKVLPEPPVWTPIGPRIRNAPIVPVEPFEHPRVNSIRAHADLGGVVMTHRPVAIPTPFTAQEIAIMREHNLVDDEGLEVFRRAGFVTDDDGDDTP